MKRRRTQPDVKRSSPRVSVHLVRRLTHLICVLNHRFADHDAEETMRGDEDDWRTGSFAVTPWKTTRHRVLAGLGVCLSLSFLLLTTLYTPRGFAMGDDADLLADHLWKHRVVLVMGGEDARGAYTRQLEAFDALDEVSSGWRERHLVLYACPGGGEAGAMRDHTSEEERRALDASACQALRGRFAEQRGFCVVLIGKDGGTKLVSDEVVATSSIFALIDSMPMRRREMKEE